jgi:hypothetical protein
MNGRVAAIAIVAIFCVATGPAGGQPAKKKCHYVIKVVHGHKHKIKVCPKPTPKIKNVTLTLDTPHRASATIAADGGSVAATSSGGTKLTLTVPKDALPGDTAITLTPVTSIAGVSGKLIAGVQLAPEGLLLAKPATLTIQSASGSPTAIVWVGTGHFAERAPVTKSGGALQLSLWHFSGAAVYDGEVRNMPNLRDGQQALYKTQVLPKMQAALNSDSAFSEAISLYLSWSRTFDLIGDPSFMASERAGLRKLIKQVFLNQINRAYDSCKTKHDVGKELRNLIAYARQAQGGAALLLENAQDAQEIQDLANDRLQKCGQFQLDFETRLVLTVDETHEEPPSTVHDIYSETTHVRVGSLPIQAVGSTETSAPPPSSAPIEILDHSYTIEIHKTGAGFLIDCSFSSTPATPSKQFSVSRLDLSAEDPPKISLEMDPGDLQSEEKGQCITTPPPDCNCGGPVTTPGTQPDFPGYFGGFYFLHANEVSIGGFTIKDWSYLGGSVWARKTHSQTVTVPFPGFSGTLTETTTFDLKHTPE